MAMPAREIEGTWEQILEHAPELAGRRVRLTILEGAAEEKAESTASDARRQKLLAWLDRQEQSPLAEEDRRLLEEFDAFRAEHPVLSVRSGWALPL